MNSGGYFSLFTIQKCFKSTALSHPLLSLTPGLSKVVIFTQINIATDVFSVPFNKMTHLYVQKKDIKVEIIIK